MHSQFGNKANVATMTLKKTEFKVWKFKKMTYLCTRNSETETKPLYNNPGSQINILAH